MANEFKSGFVTFIKQTADNKKSYPDSVHR